MYVNEFEMNYVNASVSEASPSPSESIRGKVQYFAKRQRFEQT
jgi:hypothetical protein